ncbi:hypothetical protein TNCV_949251 [Trichonephila clavipes]|nr:hypothetical protein TNCV_949251 [Trichonephila clavipes]
MEIVLQQGCLILVKAPYKEVGKNEMTTINMPKKKCALRKGATKWPILEESVANWVIENRQNGLIVTRNSVCLFALKWSKKNANENGTGDEYLFMEESNSDVENDTDFHDVRDDITGDENADLFMSSNNEIS